MGEHVRRLSFDVWVELSDRKQYEIYSELYEEWVELQENTEGV